MIRTTALIISSLAACFSCGATQVQADDLMTPLPEIERRAWAVVGRVNSAGYNTKSLCTGTLVAPQLVLTAAHCVEQAIQSDTPVHFVAGWDRGNFVAHRRSSEIALHPAYKVGGHRTTPVDFALITLVRPIASNDFKPVRVSSVTQGRSAAEMMLGYHRQRPHVLNWHRDCPHSTSDPLGLQYFDCVLAPGNSGGPVLRHTGHGWTVWAILIAQSADGRQAVAAPLDDWVLRTVREAQ